MKYGESSFDIAYLMFAVISGCLIIKRATDHKEKHMGLSSLILGLGDAFHLVPRVLNYFSSWDLTAPQYGVLPSYVSFSACFLKTDGLKTAAI